MTDEKPIATEYSHPEWLWYCESTSGVPVVSLGRWAKHPQQKRYKIAEIQPTEHDHPAPAPAVEVWPIATDDEVEALARECDWDNRKYMTTADYAIWCERMRKFARLAAPAAPTPQTEGDR